MCWIASRGIYWNISGMGMDEPGWYLLGAVWCLCGRGIAGRRSYERALGPGIRPNRDKVGSGEVWNSCCRGEYANPERRIGKRKGGVAVMIKNRYCNTPLTLCKEKGHRANLVSDMYPVPWTH